MSVISSKRKTSKAEFVYHARQIYIYSTLKAKNLDKAFTFFGKQELYKIASEIYEDAVRANSIYPVCREDYLMRRNHLMNALTNCYHLISKISVLQEVIPKLSAKSASYWCGMIKIEIDLLKAVMKSDNKRFSKL